MISGGGTGGATTESRPCVDLHAHTTASDGTASPAEFVAAALAAGLGAVAVTDHDTVAAVDEVRRLAEGTPLEVVAGVELSVHDDAGKELHLLGLHLRDLGVIEERLERLRAARQSRAARMVDRLGALGIAVSLDAVLAEAAGGAVGRPHLARALVKGGHVATPQEAFDRWIGGGRPAFVEKERLSVRDGIGMVHDAGGIAVYAHPGRDGALERITGLARDGLDGLEVRHPSHGIDDIRKLRGAARSLDLVPSGGSDWHGARDGPRTLGCMQVSAEWLDRQRERVASRRA